MRHEKHWKNQNVITDKLTIESKEGIDRQGLIDLMG